MEMTADFVGATGTTYATPRGRVVVYRSGEGKTAGKWRWLCNRCGGVSKGGWATEEVAKVRIVEHMEAKHDLI